MAKILGISDVSVGYGSPEVPALMDSICRTFGVAGILIEPDELARPPMRFDWNPAFRLHRVTSHYADHSQLWHAYYRSRAIDLVNSEKPDVLIFFGSSVFNFLQGMRHKPKKIIYHAYEFISNLPAEDIAIHSLHLDRANLIIVPEIDRLIIDAETVMVYPEKIAMIYNVADVAYPKPVRRISPDKRNGRFVWFGTLHRRQAFADYFYSDPLSEFEFDIFGRITDPEAHEIDSALRSTMNLRYFGVVSADELNTRRSENIFSLVWWNPEISAGHYYVPPNRLFTSIQAGVPPICAPHPQCIEIVKRFGCGLILDDWSIWSVQRGLRRALKLYESDVYNQMVQNCFDAADQILNWPSQYERVRPRIVETLRGVAEVAV